MKYGNEALTIVQWQGITFGGKNYLYWHLYQRLLGTIELFQCVGYKMTSCGGLTI